MPEKKKQKTYTGKFKVEAVETIRNENLSYKETARRFGLRSDTQIKQWERIYLEGGTPKQKAQVVQELRQKYPLKALLQLAGLPRSTFYYYLHRSQNPAKYQMVKEQIVTIFNENKKRYQNL